jgi:5'-3' exoribonuclease 1
MGIPKFFGWLRNQPDFKAAIGRLIPQSVEIFAIDMNALIYNNISKYLVIDVIKQEGVLMISQEELYRRRIEVFRGVFRDVVGLTEVVAPTESLILAFDGVAPQAKINQQRNRRYKAASSRKEDEVFDTNAITPGTDFMIDLDKYITEELDKIRKSDEARRSDINPYAKILPPRIVYSSHLIPGEGEHKIADILRDVPVTKGKTVVVHGMDADLVMIYLLRLRQGWDNIYLFRNNTLNYQVEVMIDLNLIAGILKQIFPRVSDPVDDFVTMMFLVGNDFLPHFPSFERIFDAFNTLVEGYKRFINETQTTGITTGSTIDWSEFTKFIEFITKNYDTMLLKLWGENADNQIKFPSAVSEKCIVQSRQVIGTTTRCVRTLDVEMFKKQWYIYVFSPKTGNGLINPTEGDIKSLINYYLEGVAWTHSYYMNGVSSVNVGWYYPNHYAPLFSDLHTYMNNNSPVEWETSPLLGFSNFLTPLEVIVTVMPQKSLSSIPNALHLLYTQKSQIFDLLPSSFIVDTQGKMEEWESIAILPFPNPTRIKAAVNSLNLPPEYISRFKIPDEPVIINRNIAQTFRVTRGGGYRGRGDGSRGGGRGDGSRGGGRGDGSRGGGRGDGSRGGGRGDGSRGGGRGDGSRGGGRGDGSRGGGRGDGSRGYGGRGDGSRGGGRGDGSRGYGGRGDGSRGGGRGDGSRGYGGRGDGSRGYGGRGDGSRGYGGRGDGLRGGRGQAV